MTQQLQFVQIVNPFSPRDSLRSTRDFAPGQSLADLFVSPLATPMVYSLNGKVVDDAELASTFPAAGDFVVACPVPQGGGDGEDDGTKTALRIIATLIITYFTMGTDGGTIGGALFGAGTTAAAVANAAVMVVGTMAVNAMLAPTVTKKESLKDSPTYGIDGAKNTSADGIPMPVVYGRYRVAGNFLNNYIVNDGDNQYLYSLVCMGEGPIGSLSEVQIDDQPIENYTDYEIKQYLGTPDQEPPEWFADTITPQSIQKKLTMAWQTATTSTAVDRLRIDILAPGGVYNAMATDGTLVETGANVLVQYRKVGTTTWLEYQPVTGIAGYTDRVVYYDVQVYPDGSQHPVPYPYLPTGQEVTENDIIWNNADKELQVGEIAHDPIYMTAGIIEFNGATKKPQRRSFLSPKLEQAFYEVRFSRSDNEHPDSRVVSTLYVTDLNEIVEENVGYRHTAALGLKIRVSEQLNSLPNVTAMHGGKLVRTWGRRLGISGQAPWGWNSEPSDNPAWIAMDILMSGGASLGQIDIPLFRDWAEFCADKKLTFNGVFDTSSNVWDAANVVARCGRGQVIRVGTRYSVLIERAAAPTMMFSVANMIQGTFKTNWTSLSDRANEIELSFQDKEANYQTRRVRVYDEAAIAAGQPQRPLAVTMMGVVDYQRAFDEAMLMLNLNRYIRRTVEFSAPLEAIACSVGDVVLVQHDMPQWGYGGRLATGSTTTTLKLDREVEMESGKTYQALVHFNSLPVGSGIVESVSGTTAWLEGFNGQSAHRIVVNGVDMGIKTVRSLGGSFGVDLGAEMTAEVMPGAGYQLFVTNALVTRDVLNVSTGDPVKVSQLTLSSPLPAAAPQFVKWLFGPTNKVAKPFRVQSIAGSHEYRRDIRAIEYNESVYDPAGAAPTPNYSDLDDAILGAVQDLTAVEDSTRSPIDGTASVAIIVKWTPINNALLRGYVVSVRDRTGQVVFREEMNASSVLVENLTGGVYTVSVYAVNIYGRHGPVSTVAVATSGENSTYVVPEVEDLSAELEVDDNNRIRLSMRWKAVDYPGHARVEIYRANLSENQVLQMMELSPGGGGGTRIKFDWQVPNPTPAERMQATLAIANSTSVKLLYSGVANECVIDEPQLGDCVLLAVNRTNIGEYSAFANWKYVLVDPDEVSEERPPTPVGFSAEPVGMTTVLTHWSTPNYTEGGGHRQTNIYAVRKAKNDPTLPIFADAIRVASALDPILQADFTGPGAARWHVWARWMTKKGAESLIPAGGTHGIEVETEMDVQAIIDLLDGDIAESMLDPALRDKIEKIELIDTINGDETITGSIAWNRAQEANARALAIEAEVLARTDADNVLFNSLTTNYTNAVNGVFSSAQSYVQGYSYSKSESDGALSALSNTLTTGYTTYADGRYTAAINYVNSYTYSIANANSAINASANTLRSEFQAGDNSLLNTVNSTLTTNYYTQAQANQAIASSIAEAATRVGGNYEAVHTWDFRSEANNWFVHQGTITPHQNSIVYAVQGFDSHLAVIFPTEINGNIWEKVRMRLRHFGGTIGSWEGNLYYSTAGHAWDNQYRKQIPKPATIDTGGGWIILEWDMTALTQGANDYLSSTIYGLRFDLVNDGSGSPVFEIDWVSVGRYGPGTSATRIADIEQSVSTGDTALAQQISVVQGQVTTGDQTLLGVIQSERQIAVDREQVIAESVTTLQGVVTSNHGNVMGVIQDERQLAVSREQVIAESVTTLQGQVVSNNNTMLGTIQDERSLAIGREGIIANSVTDLQGQVNNNWAALSQQNQLRIDEIGNIHTQWTVKSDVNGYISGVGFANSARVNETPTSSFIVRADRFVIGSPTGPNITAVNPFYVQTVPTTINDEPVPVGVYMTNAFIANGSITNAKIGNLSADKITAGFINAARIAAGSITADKVNTTNMHVRGAISGGAITGWPNWGPAGSTGFYLGPEGFMMGSLASNQYVAIGANGEFYAPGFTITAGGNAVFSGTVAANVIRTNSIVGGDISRTAAQGTSGNEVTVTITLEHAAAVSMIGTVTIPFQGPGGQYMRINGSPVRGETVVNGVVCTLCYASSSLPAGTYDFTMGASNAGAMNAFIQVTAMMR